MGDDQHPLAGVPARDVHDCGQYAREVVVPGFAVVFLGPGESLLDLGAGQSGPGADVDLSQAGVLDKTQLTAGDDDSSGLGGPPEIAGVRDVQRLVHQRARQLSRLLPPGVVQRRIGVALVPAVPVPVGLSVADDDELGHVGLDG